MTALISVENLQVGKPFITSLTARMGERIHAKPTGQGGIVVSLEAPPEIKSLHPDIRVRTS